VALKDIVFGTLVVSLSFGVYYYNKYEQLHPKTNYLTIGEEVNLESEYYVKGPNEVLSGIKTSYYISKEKNPSLFFSKKENHMTYSKKRIFSKTEYENGFKNGSEIFYEEYMNIDGALIPAKQTTWKDGKKEGIESFTSSENNKIEIRYKSGGVIGYKTNGKTTEFKSEKPYNGQIYVFEGNLRPKPVEKMEILDGVQKERKIIFYHPNGKLKKEYSYKDGLLEGNFYVSEKFPNKSSYSAKTVYWSEIQTTIPFVKGKRDGIQKKYYYSSSIRPRTAFLGLLDTGFLNKNNNLLNYEETIWKNGDKISSELYLKSDKKQTATGNRQYRSRNSSVESEVDQIIAKSAGVEIYK
jgi:antitoxin component YwqK of YwqJK toxin-antitoxin module